MVQQSKKKAARGLCIDPRFATELVPLWTSSISSPVSQTSHYKNKTNKKHKPHTKTQTIIKYEHQVYPVPKESSYRDSKQVQRKLD